MNELDNLYKEIILEAAKERYGEGPLENADGISHQVNPSCGDEVTMRVNLSDDGTRIDDIAWEGQGCSISQASISIMTDMLEGESFDTFQDLYGRFRQMMDSQGEELPSEVLDSLEDAAAFHGVSKFPMRIKCALLGWMAIKDACAQAIATKESNRE
ncbi:MAG: SUF system NifU family Fe-S cluster assembly protein [Actinomycetaceae bacterium]|nr:SUF system NifU family Fe-S cluster assembly protein [Actinomycetaceae bacterium]